MSNYAYIVLSVLFVWAQPVLAAEEVERSRPIAEILGKPVTLQDLDAGIVPNAATTPTAEDSDALKNQRRERLRALVWSAVFDDYARRNRIEPTSAELESHITYHRKFQQQDRARREKQRLELIEELKSPTLNEARRKQAQPYLDTLNRLKEFDAQREQELRDPERQRMNEQAERSVAIQWVRRWKVNQALHREFGGRIIFQQAGMEPIDAYRKLIEGYEAKRSFVVHEPAFRDAVYSYFRHNFTYADETKARFYFEKPYWERTETEMRAAGF